MSRILLKYCLGYDVDILHDVVAARAWINYFWSHGLSVWNLCFSEGWVAGCQVQLVEGVVAESLLRHTWSICLLGCLLCELWLVSRSRVKSIVEWRGVWVRCVLPFLRIQCLWPCSCHLMSLCRSWCWSCWCWEVEKFHQKASNVKCFCCPSVDGIIAQP